MQIIIFNNYLLSKIIIKNFQITMLILRMIFNWI